MLIRSNRAGKMARVLQCEYSFSSLMRTNLHVGKICLLSMMHLLCIRATTPWINADEWQIKGIALTGNWRSSVVASRALNMSVIALDRKQVPVYWLTDLSQFDGETKGVQSYILQICWPWYIRSHHNHVPAFCRARWLAKATWHV